MALRFHGMEEVGVRFSIGPQKQGVIDDYVFVGCRNYYFCPTPKNVLLGKISFLYPSHTMEDTLQKIFLAAYDAHSEAIYRHCFFRLSSHERAEEFVQEVFLKTWQYLSQGKRVENIRAFLYRVATNMIVDEYRRKKETSLEGILEKSENAGFTEPMDDSIEHQTLVHEIKNALDKLSEDAREVIVMRYMDDLGPREIAEVLGITANAVSVRINRALKELKNIYSK